MGRPRSWNGTTTHRLHVATQRCKLLAQGEAPHPSLCPFALHGLLLCARHPSKRKTTRQVHRANDSDVVARPSILCSSSAANLKAALGCASVLEMRTSPCTILRKDTEASCRRRSFAASFPCRTSIGSGFAFGIALTSPDMMNSASRRATSASFRSSAVSWRISRRILRFWHQSEQRTRQYRADATHHAPSRWTHSSPWLTSTHSQAASCATPEPEPLAAAPYAAAGPPSTPPAAAAGGGSSTCSVQHWRKNG
jgi:hypothetical protein